MKGGRRPWSSLHKIAGLALGTSGLAVAAGAYAQAGDTNPRRSPEQIYDTNCGYCHGHNVGPIIKGRKLPAQAIEYFVRHGNGAMPAFKPTEISPEELKALGEWISESGADEGERGK